MRRTTFWYTGKPILARKEKRKKGHRYDDTHTPKEIKRTEKKIHKSTTPGHIGSIRPLAFQQSKPILHALFPFAILRFEKEEFVVMLVTTNLARESSVCLDQVSSSF